MPHEEPARVTESAPHTPHPTLIKQAALTGLWAFEKPSGWLTHPDGSERPDVITWSQQQPGLPRDLAPLHRLDVGTSGVLCCAEGAHLAQLGALWSSRQASKRYIALAEGRLRPKGVIKRPLQDGRRGKPLKATTRYKSLAIFKGCTLIEVRLEEGRKHQIRRHLQGVGSGVVGDARYPVPKRTPLKGAPSRLWLHAATLSLPLDDGSTLTLSAQLPPELRAHLKALWVASAEGSVEPPQGSPSDSFDDLLARIERP